ncbi:unnamed protein product [Rhizophagus irregularis]|uniref:NYN domain-containing protein n=5 Tax=Rhizophagus irregularis TaxID=588596 RepID=A0A915ZB08_9GLOM|nr:NYN domain-containing protein [Rhizophagus irregularis DAOM 181602=DAOM 197198]CAB4477554.1 unnamed protein product [Rhizophagus irregularis]CAB5367965.1 unnamed protein product [Rhizophagus irregularis]CAG8569526.1 5591_t:CDS:2 [Rhizophagus irregularis]
MSIYNIINDLTFTEQEKTKLRSYFFKHSDKVDMAMEILNSCNSPKEKFDFMRETFLKPEPAENKGSPEDLYIIIDNSNFYIGAFKSICQMEGLSENFQLFIDYGRLLRVIQKTRNLGRPPIIIGFRPPPLDSLWNRIRRDGYDIHIYDKIIITTNNETVTKEKMVDNAIGFHIDEVIFTKTPATIALVSGDCDYFRNIQGALERKWKVELWAWHSGITNYHYFYSDPLFYAKNNMYSPGVVKKPFLQTTFIPLDNYYKIFSWGYGVANTEEMKILQLSDGDEIRIWENDDVMNCYVALDLFGWWHRYKRGILLLYFRSNEELQKAQLWVHEKHPNIRVKKL